jgi:cell division protein FtsW
MTNTNRWIKIPVLGFTFQPSTLASTILLIYIVRYFAKIKDEIISFSKTILPLWLPVFTVVVLILPANFSTAAILFTLVLIISFLGGYPKRYLILIVSTGLFVLTLFVLTIKAYPELMPNRIDTWSNRIENFIDSENTESNYQIEKAKIAIATGGIKGLGPGKSVQKNFLPQSSSDFIYAIIIEEFGLIGGFFLVILYVWLLFRVVIVSVKSETVFGSLLAISMGLPIIFQAFINMSVAVELMPITGQTLPLISSGGTSIWMTCLSIGIILSVSRRYKDQNEVVDHNNPLEILKETI